jgi:hypothetical protein
VAFLRRAQDAHAAFQNARTVTLDFVAKAQPGNPGVRRYYAAVGAWETFALQSAMSMDLFAGRIKARGRLERGMSRPSIGSTQS